MGMGAAVALEMHAGLLQAQRTRQPPGGPGGCPSKSGVLLSWVLLWASTLKTAQLACLPRLAVGLLGGAVYVNAFTLISKEVPPQYR